MRPERPSRSAAYVAALRGLGTLLPEDCRLIDGVPQVMGLRLVAGHPGCMASQRGFTIVEEIVATLGADVPPPVAARLCARDKRRIAVAELA